jgi:DNA-directed RNA polymerase subunit RPC12/RpoP
VPSSLGRALGLPSHVASTSKHAGNGDIFVDGLLHPLTRFAETCSSIAVLVETVQREGLFKGARVPKNLFVARDVKIIRCPYCGSHGHHTLAWTRSHRDLKCSDCGEEFSQNKNIRKALDAGRRKLSKIASQLRMRRAQLSRLFGAAKSSFL